MTAARVPPVTWTTAEAAAAAGRTRETIQEWARRGHVEAVQVDGQWLLDGGSLLAYAARPVWRPSPGPRLPAAPLLRQIALRGGPAACGVGQHTAEEKALERAQQDGHLSVWMADHLAIRLLGVHPVVLWGDDYLAA